MHQEKHSQCFTQAHFQGNGKLLNQISVVFLVYGLQGDLETLVLFPFWMLRKVCKCMCTELKADLMGSGELEPSDIPSDPWQP